MGFFSRLFGKKGRQADATQDDTGGRNSSYEKQMGKHFGLEFRGNGWSYEGNVNQDFASQLGNPELCLAVLGALRAKLGFDQVCILAGKPVVVVCNSTPPLGIVTLLNASAIADLVVTIIKANGKQVYEYQGAFWLSLA